jgi:glycosyltransferase involved in cell wall biosynthesis
MDLILSVIIPVYNERGTIEEIVQRVRTGGVAKEIVIVNDGSEDGTGEILKALAEFPEVTVIEHPENRGKGAAVVTGIHAAGGDVLVVQDADLEYDPAEYPNLIAPIEMGEVNVVYGSRFAAKTQRPALANWLANWLLTKFTNLLYNARLTDMETCYKMFRREIVDDLVIHARRFDFEPEFTAKLLKRGIEIREVPISFNPRRYSEGKKITFWDGLEAVWTLVKYRFVE